LTKAETPIHPAPIAEAEQRQREFEKQKAAEAEAAKEPTEGLTVERGGRAAWMSLRYPTRSYAHLTNG
jgi:hypothetical protein